MLEASVERRFREHVAAIQVYRAQDLNEAMTRKYLIDPLLAILGYASPDELHLEVRVPNTGDFIDYELIVDGKARAVVEAKSIRNEINEQHAAQCVKYAALLGVQWCLVTNGITWAIYDAYAPVSLTDKQVVMVRLDDAQPLVDEAWRVLSDFGRDSLRQSQPLSEILIERIVIQELQRPDSGVVTALRSAVRSRVGHRVSTETVQAAVSRIISTAPSASVSNGGKSRGAPRPDEESVARGGLRDLIDSGLLPPDATLHMSYKGAKFTGRLNGGKLEVNGVTYASLSRASCELRQVPASNGWRDWSFNGESLDEIKRRWKATLSKRDR